MNAYIYNIYTHTHCIYIYIYTLYIYIYYILIFILHIDRHVAHDPELALGTHALCQYRPNRARSDPGDCPPAETLRTICTTDVPLYFQHVFQI